MAEDENLKIETEDPTGKLISPVDAEGNKMPARLLMPDSGFDHNPAKEAWKPDLKKYPPELRKQFEAERIASTKTTKEAAPMMSSARGLSRCTLFRI